MSLTQEQCAGALQRLGLPVVHGEGTLTVTPPTFRFDITGPQMAVVKQDEATTGSLVSDRELSAFVDPDDNAHPVEGVAAWRAALAQCHAPFQSGARSVDAWQPRAVVLGRGANLVEIEATAALD